MISLLFNLVDPTWWLIFALPLPGLLAWFGASIAPHLLARTTPRYNRCYRLVYDAPEDWRDNKARIALLNLIRAGTGLDIIWVRDGEGVGCWLAVTGHGHLLERLVRDVFPAGAVEIDVLPKPETGVVVLRWKTKQDEVVPGPVELCRLEGIEGLYFRWRSERSATVALWGPAAAGVARQFAGRRDLLPGRGEALLRPPFTGDNPWPNLPPFPPSHANPGLAAVSRLERLAPALRVNDPRTALVIGQDAGGQPVGFALPELPGMQPLQVVGRAAERVTVSLAYQAIQAGLPVLFLDGRGTATARLARQLMRETATGQVLMCDVERPARSRFRLNPLWLPGDAQTWPRILSTGWVDWLRELGVTPAGLGQVAYRHTQVAVTLTALVAAQRGLSLDVPGLREALASPDFLTMVGDELLPEGILDQAVWSWWLAEGRTTPNFDVHLRLGHLRDRLNTLLDRPEYGLLWQPPYLDPLTALVEGTSLFWRLPDPRQRLRAYITSQLLALTTLLTVWPVEQPPPLVFLHELAGGTWLKRLGSFSTARLVLSAERATSLPAFGESASLLLSRLEQEDAGQMQNELPGIRPTDLRRLPPNRLLLRRGQAIGTLDMKD